MSSRSPMHGGFRAAPLNGSPFARSAVVADSRKRTSRGCRSGRCSQRRSARSPIGLMVASSHAEQVVSMRARVLVEFEMSPLVRRVHSVGRILEAMSRQWGVGAPKNARISASLRDRPHAARRCNRERLLFSQREPARFGRVPKNRVARAALSAVECHGGRLRTRKGADRGWPEYLRQSRFGRDRRASSDQCASAPLTSLTKPSRAMSIQADQIVSMRRDRQQQVCRGVPRGIRFIRYRPRASLTAHELASTQTPWPRRDRHLCPDAPPFATGSVFARDSLLLLVRQPSHRIGAPRLAAFA